MASIAVRLTADVAGLTQGFGQAEKMAEGFRNRLTQIGRATAKAFIPTGVSVSAVATDLGNLASVASSSAAILSKFTQGNKEMQERLEQVTVTLAIAAPAIRGFGSALRLATGPIGLVVTALVGAILVLRNWETVTRAVIDTAARVWAKLAEFFLGLWGGLGQAAQGLGQILLGALTLDVASIQEGYQQMISGFTAVKDTMVTAAVGIASGVGVAVTKLTEMVSSIAGVQEETKKLREEILTTAQAIIDASTMEAAALQSRIQIHQEEMRLAEEAAIASHDAAIAAMETQAILDEAARGSLLLREESNRMAEAEILMLNTVAQAQLAKAEQEKVLMEEARQRAVETASLLAVLFGQNKAFAIASALIAIYQAAAQALRDLPFPANLIAWAKVLALGLSAVATIKGVKMAHGGIVTQPIRPLIGEAGPEAVIPLSGSRGRAALATLGGGGEIHITVMLDERTLLAALVPNIPGFVRVRAGIRGV